MIVWSVVVGPWFKLWNVCQAAMASRQVHSCAPPEGGMRAASCALVLLGRRRCIESRPWAQQRRAGRWCCRLAIAGLACHALGPWRLAAPSFSDGATSAPSCSPTRAPRVACEWFLTAARRCRAPRRRAAGGVRGRGLPGRGQGKVPREKSTPDGRRLQFKGLGFCLEQYQLAQMYLLTSRVGPRLCVRAAMEP